MHGACSPSLDLDYSGHAVDQQVRLLIPSEPSGSGVIIVPEMGSELERSPLPDPQLELDERY